MVTAMPVQGCKRAAIYIRVSTLDQVREGYSLAAQQKALEALAQIHGYDVLRVYADEGISGKDIDHRPAMQRLLTDIKSNSYDILMVWALSRLTRSVADLYDTWEVLCAHGASLVSYTESFDTTTPTGRAMMGLLGVFAQMEREITAERVRSAMAERAGQGKRTCNDVLGYDLLGKDSFSVNPAESIIVQYIFDQYIKRQSLTVVAKLCEGMGYIGKRGSNIKPESIRKILTCPVYAGYNRFRGDLYHGDHPPIVTVRQYNRVQHILMRRSIGRAGAKTLHLLSDKNCKNH